MIEYTTYNSLESKISSIPWEPLPLFWPSILHRHFFYCDHLYITPVYCDHLYIIHVHCDHLYIIPVYRDNLYIIPVYRDHHLSMIHWKILRMNVLYKYICTIYTCLETCLMSISRFSLRDKVTLRLLKLHFYGADVVEWLRALDIRLSEWCCSVSMVWVQIPSREEHKFDNSKI